MRILIQNYFDSPVGGVESYLSNLSHVLKEFGHQVVFVYTQSGRKPPQLDAYNTPAYYLPNLSRKLQMVISSFERKILAYIRSGKTIKGALVSPFLMIEVIREHRRLVMKDLKQLLEIIKSEKIDILFLNNFDGLFLFKFMRSPVVVIQMVHDYFWICPKILKLIQLYQEDTICTHPFGPACFENKCLSYLSTVGLLEVMRRYFYVDCLSKIPAQIVCASSFIKEAYAQNGIPHQKVNVVPLFIDPKRQTHGLDETKRRILFVGRISYEKGLSYLLKALAGLSDFELDVIGEGEDVSSNKVLAQKFGLQEKVNFRGWMSHSAIEHLMDEARLVVLPSIWPEPFGMVGLEAMASGKAVVAFDVGGVREWLKDSQNGFLVPNKDIHQLKEKINLLLRDERIALEMGKAGKELINNFFSTQKYVNRLTEVFKKALTTSK